MNSRIEDLKVVVVLPCHNEAAAIGNVVRDMLEALPSSEVHVFDNNSTDNTAEVAREAGATVHKVRMQGKGNVIRQAFAVLDADIYVMADGDRTYPAEHAPALIQQLLDDELDMVVGARQSEEIEAYRRGHRFGNWLFNRAVRVLFGQSVRDLFSGYRVFSRPFVKSFPALATGFEIETELFLHAVSLRAPFAETDVPYLARIEGSESKLRSLRDGSRIAAYIARLLMILRPLIFFGAVTALMVTIGLVLGLPVVVEYFETGLVQRFPTAFAAASVMVIAAVSLNSGLALDALAVTRREQKRLVYLSLDRWCKRSSNARDSV